MRDLLLYATRKVMLVLQKIMGLDDSRFGFFQLCYLSGLQQVIGFWCLTGPVCRSGPCQVQQRLRICGELLMDCCVKVNYMIL